MSTQHDPAASYRRYTPRQAAQAAARHNREARDTIAACKAHQEAEARAKAIARAVHKIELLGEALLSGVVRPSRRPLTRDERKVCAEEVRSAWTYLRRVDPDCVTVLA